MRQEGPYDGFPGSVMPIAVLWMFTGFNSPSSLYRQIVKYKIFLVLFHTFQQDVGRSFTSKALIWHKASPSMSCLQLTDITLQDIRKIGFTATNIQKFPRAAFNGEIKLRTNRCVLLEINNNISVAHQGSTYVWNSTHNSASALGSAWKQAAAWCVLPRCSQECGCWGGYWGALGAFTPPFLCARRLRLCPTAFLFPRWLFFGDNRIQLWGCKTLWNVTEEAARPANGFN